MMHDAQWKRSCATCMHKTALGKRKPPECTGCIKSGTLTRWEALRLTEEKQAALIHKSTT